MKLLVFSLIFFIFDRSFSNPIFIENNQSFYKKELGINVSDCMLKTSSKISLILCDSFFILIRNSQIEKNNIQLKKYVISERIVFFDIFSNYALVSTRTAYFYFFLNENNLLQFFFIQSIERNYTKLKGLEVGGILYLIGFFEKEDNLYFDTYFLNIDHNYFRRELKTFSKTELKISDVRDINIFYNNFQNELEVFLHSVDKIIILKSQKYEFYFKYFKEIYLEEKCEGKQNNEILIFKKNGELIIYYYHQFYNNFILLCKYSTGLWFDNYYFHFLFHDATNLMNMNQIGIFFPNEKIIKLLSILNSNTSPYIYPICKLSDKEFPLPEIYPSIAFVEISLYFSAILMIEHSYFLSFPLCIESTIQLFFQSLCPRFSNQALNQCKINEIFFYDKCVDGGFVANLQWLCSDFSDCFNCSQVTSCEWNTRKNICEKKNNSFHIPYFLKKCPLLPICNFQSTNNGSGIITFNKNIGIFEQNSFCNWVIITSKEKTNFNLSIMIKEGFITKEYETKVEMLISFYNSKDPISKKEFKKLTILFSSSNEHEIFETDSNVFEIFLTFYSKILIDPTKFKIIYNSNEKKSDLNEIYFIICIFISSLLIFIVFSILISMLIKNGYFSSRTSFSLERPLLIKYSFEAEMVPYQQSHCPICLENLNENKKIVETLCKHIFHENCFQIWNRSVERDKLKCPICRTYLFI